MRVHLDKNTTQVLGENRVEGLKFQDGTSLDVDMVIVSAGIIPRDDSAKTTGITDGRTWWHLYRRSFTHLGT